MVFTSVYYCTHIGLYYTVVCRTVWSFLFQSVLQCTFIHSCTAVWCILVCTLLWCMLLLRIALCCVLLCMTLLLCGVYTLLDCDVCFYE